MVFLKRGIKKGEKEGWKWIFVNSNRFIYFCKLKTCNFYTEKAKKERFFLFVCLLTLILSCNIFLSFFFVFLFIVSKYASFFFNNISIFFTFFFFFFFFLKMNTLFCAVNGVIRWWWWINVCKPKIIQMFRIFVNHKRRKNNFLTIHQNDHCIYFCFFLLLLFFFFTFLFYQYSC